MEWTARAAEREAELEVELARARTIVEDDEAEAALAAREIERVLTDLRTIRPALDALVGLARYAMDGDLAALWPAMREFLDNWLLQPGETPGVQTLLEDRLGALAADSTSGRLKRDDALRLIEEAIRSTRVTTGRFR